MEGRHFPIAPPGRDYDSYMKHCGWGKRHTTGLAVTTKNVLIVVGITGVWKLKVLIGDFVNVEQSLCSGRESLGGSFGAINFVVRWNTALEPKPMSFEFMDGLGYTTIIEFVEPLARRRGSAFRSFRLHIYELPHHSDWTSTCELWHLNLSDVRRSIEPARRQMICRFRANMGRFYIDACFSRRRCIYLVRIYNFPVTDINTGLRFQGSDSLYTRRSIFKWRARRWVDTSRATVTGKVRPCGMTQRLSQTLEVSVPIYGGYGLYRSELRFYSLWPKADRDDL